MSKTDELELGNQPPVLETPINVKQRLDDKDFLNFLQKNPDAIQQATNDEYIRQKADIFDKLKQVKQKAKQYLVKESDESYGVVVEGNFFDGMEDVAINNPKDFLDFYAGLNYYLGSEERIRALAEQYQEAAKFLGVEYGDFSAMSGAERKAFVANIHEKIQEMNLENAHTLETTESLQPLTSRIPFTLKRKVWLESMELIKRNIADIKLVSDNLNKTGISYLISQIEFVKGLMRDNKAFGVLHQAFMEEAAYRINRAVIKKDTDTLVKEKNILSSSNTRQGVISEKEYEIIERVVSEQLKQQILQDSSDVLEGEESITYSSLQGGFNDVYKRGLELGLSKSECRQEMILALKNKEEEIFQSTNRDSQANIKLILIRRMLINIE